ncbi:glycosyltransferase [Xanthobacter sp. V0B-10]|uniref:glycosyltransferase family 2 protein n=1 Tax=Xanthobacter albus TaxID=3119929 RepID=UPI003728493A
MSKVTICIPVYRASSFLHQTLSHLLKQTYRDIRIDLAIEPEGEDEARICERFSDDGRVHYRVNDRVLGWAENIAAMLRRVSSPFFLVLPHDDFLHPRYVEWLLPVVEADPRVVSAYGDIQFLNAARPTRRSQILDEGPVAERLISFLAAGGEAPPWRGLTRSEVLTASAFPVDAFRGFLVECEWAFHLLTQGIARHVPRTLYFKRLHADGRVTASVARNRVDLSVQRAGLEDHRLRLRRRAAAALPVSPQLQLVEAGIDAVAALRFLSGRLGPGEVVEEQLRRALAICDHHSEVSGAIRIRSLAHVALAHFHAQNGRDPKAALEAAERAVAADPGSPLALQVLARQRLDAGDAFGALVANAALGDVAPWFMDSDALQAAAEAAFQQTLSGPAEGGRL